MAQYLDYAKNIAWDTVKTTAAVMAVNMTVSRPIHDMIPSNNIVVAYGADGACYALASEVVELFTGGNSNLKNMQYTKFMDDALFMGVVAGTTEQAGLAQFALKTIDTANLPLSTPTKVNIVQGLTVASARELSKIIESSELGQNPMIAWVRYPMTQLLGKSINQ